MDTTLVKAVCHSPWMGRRKMPFQNKVIVRNQRFDPFDPPTRDPLASITIPPETPQSGSLFRASPETLQCPGYYPFSARSSRFTGQEKTWTAGWSNIRRVSLTGPSESAVNISDTGTVANWRGNQRCWQPHHLSTFSTFGK